MSNRCSKCNGIILADTEEWDETLCYTHYHQHLVDEAYEKFSDIIGEMSTVLSKAVNLRDEMKEIISKEKTNE